MEQGNIMEAEVPTVRVGATPTGLRKLAIITKFRCITVNTWQIAMTTFCLIFSPYLVYIQLYKHPMTSRIRAKDCHKATAKDLRYEGQGFGFWP